MEILIIGGTRFVGRHLVEAAVKRGHELTLFHRGKTNPGLFSEVDEVFGDRLEDIEQLHGQWDVAVDTCGYFPRAVRLAAEHLRDRVDRYFFVSTIAVYRDLSRRGVDETAYLKTLEDPDLEEVNSSTYGPLKTECEGVVTGIFDHRHFIVRPGVIAGPADPTDRFTYWVRRVADGGEVLAPGRPKADIQVIDVRDLADWIVDSIEEGRIGIYNATGRRRRFEAMLDACRRAADSDASFTWIPAAFLHRMGIDRDQKMPLFNHEADGRKAGLYGVDSSKARRHGLKLRPLEETAKSILSWLETEEIHDWNAGISRFQEQRVLREWGD